MGPITTGRSEPKLLRTTLFLPSRVLGTGQWGGGKHVFLETVLYFYGKSHTHPCPVFSCFTRLEPAALTAISSEALSGDCSLGGKWEQAQNLWKYRCNPPHCKGTCLPLLPFSVPTFHPYPLPQPSPGSRLQQQTGYRDSSPLSPAFTSCCPRHQKEISNFWGEGLVSPRPKEEKLFWEELQGLAV